MRMLGHSLLILLCGAACAGKTLTTAPDPPIPEPMPTFGAVIWHDDFQSYTNSANLIAAYDHLNGESQIFIDPTGGYGGSQGARIDWSKQTNTATSSGGCADDDHLLERGFTPTTEIYVQYYVRYQPGFQFDWNAARAAGIAGNCTGNAKKLFLVPSASGARLQLVSENHHIVLYTENQLSLMVGLPGIQNVGAEFTPEDLGDGNWHRITIHAKMSSTPAARDGFLYGWIDGNLKWSNPAYPTGNAGGWDYFQTPTVLNSGSPIAQSEWLDNLVVWKP